jgi:hypothetical protein
MARLRDLIRDGQVGQYRAQVEAEQQPLPPGNYRLELERGELVEDQSSDRLDLHWAVRGGPYKDGQDTGQYQDRKIHQKLRFAGRALGRTLDDIKLLGIVVEKDLDATKLPELPVNQFEPAAKRFKAPVPVGIVVGAVLKTAEYNGHTFTRVDSLRKVLRPAPDLTDFGPDPHPTPGPDTTQPVPPAPPPADPDDFGAEEAVTGDLYQPDGDFGRASDEGSGGNDADFFI